MNDPNATSSLEDIAIVGMAGRFPGARDVEEFWRNLCERRDSISFFSDEEVEAEGVEPALLKSPKYVKAGGVIEDAQLFDAAFFGVTPREAEVMDPQQRVFLECAWSALEHAGYDPEAYTGKIGVYAGAGINRYLLNIYSNPRLLETVGAFQAVIGNEKDHLTTLVSYKLNLKGPSVAVQTTCSTSLVAVGMACQSLLCYQTDMALAGGVSIRVPEKTGYLYEEGGIGSPDGRCRAFDAKAQGIVGGDGAGVVVLKRLGDALADGDCVHAVIKGSAINNDGSAKVGYTAPSVGGQAEVITEALSVARVHPETIGYVEAHGTGTALGDPIEVAALTQAYRAATKKNGFCALGSVKTNIGHLNTAAGVAGLIKATLALRHKLLPPTLHYERPNPKIDFPSTPFFVNTQLAEWPANATPRRAGVSSFGIGGTNVHVVLEEAPAREPSSAAGPGQLLLLSARTESALETATANLAEHLRRHADVNLADVAYTLQVGRRAFEHRRAIVCRDVGDAVEALSAPAPPRARTNRAASKARPLVMMFPGQGSQHVGMARDLYEHEGAFREQVDLCSEMLLPHLGLDLREVIYPKNEQGEGVPPRLDSTCFAQPALFVVEYALARLWMSWGVKPAVMIGHSVGEYVAACLAGVMSLGDALTLVAARGRLMQQMERGAMLAVPLAEADVRLLLNGDERLSLAAVNAPSLCVVSGTTEAVEQLAARCAAGGIGTRPLHTSHAFHSAMMEPMLDEFLRHVQRVKLSAPRIPFVSNVSGTWITDEEATTPVYWTKHLRQTVRFADGVAELLKSPGRIFLEVGPGHALSGSVRQVQGLAADALTLNTLPPQHVAEPDIIFALDALGGLWAAGAKVDWNGFNEGGKRRRLPLPAYPFERQRYWIERAKDALQPSAASPAKRPEPADRFYAPVWIQSPWRNLRPAAATDAGPRTLVLTDDCGLGVELAKRLEGLGREVVTVAAGEDFARLGGGAYVVNPERREDYERLFAALSADGAMPRKIVHLWSLTPESVDARASLEFDGRHQARGFYSLVLLGQMLAEQDGAHRFDIEVVTNGLHDVTGGEQLCPQKATILGACKVIPQEIPNVNCRSVDVVLGDAGGVTRGLVEQLAEELTREEVEPLVAYRVNHRWVRRVERVRLDKRAGHGEPLRERGVYLFTGGLRGVGFALAEHLARTLKARLILAEQSGFPARDEWDAWLSARGGQDEVSDKIRKARALEESGGEVWVMRVEMFDHESVQAAVAEARERFGEINGVFHTETNPGQEFVISKRTNAAADALTVNVRGALLLESVLKDAEPDFMLLCSSSNSITGGQGQLDDCATSAFLDALAHRRSSIEGRPTLAIDWDVPLWSDSPAHLLALDTELETQARETRERDGLSPDDGVAAFERLMPFPLAQVVVSLRDFAAGPAPHLALDAAHFSEKLKAASASNQGAARARSNSVYVPPGNQVERTIAEAWQAVLGVKSVGVHDNFFDLGGNSLLGIQLMSMLRKAFLLELPMSSLFEAPTVAEQAVVVSEMHRKEDELKELERMLSEIESLSPEDLEHRLALMEQTGGAEAV